MQRFKRLICALISGAVLLALTSCVTVNLPKAETDTDAPATETEASTGYDYDIVDNNFIHQIDRYLNMTGKMDYGGTSFMIAATDSSLLDGEENGSALSREKYFRNKRVEDTFNVKLSKKVLDREGLYDELWGACTADTYFADLLMIPQDMVASLAVSGLLFNLNSLPFSDFESDFNIDSGVEAGMANSTGWAVAGWSTLDPDMLPAVFFNKELIKSTGLEDPYKLVKEGRWTWDVFFKYASALSDVDGVYSYGAQNTATTLADIIYFSEGNRFVSAGLGNYPAIAMDADSLSHTVETLRRVYDDPKKISNPFDAVSLFASGSSAFLIDRLATMRTISNSAAVWGILPMPKKDAEQESYISLVPSEGLMLAVPANTLGAERASKIISGLNICSLGCIVDSYLTECMYYYLRDNSSIDSVERICYGATWDMAYTEGGEYDTWVSNCTYFAIRDVFENGHDIGDFIERFAEGASSALGRLFG